MIDRSTPPPISNFEKVELNFPNPITLSNGISVWVVDKGDDEVNRLDLYIGGGTLEEPTPMLAYLSGILCFEGSASRSAEAISEAFDYYGAIKSAQPFDHCTLVSVSMANRHFKSITEIICDCICEPLYSPGECEIYKKSLASNLAIAQERVDFLASKAMKRLYYGAHHPAAREATPEGLMSITREDLLRFHREYYHPQNLRIIISGKVGEHELAVLEATFGAWQKKGQKVDESLEPPIVSGKEKLSVIDKKGAVQSGIEMCIRAIPRQHPDYFKLRLLVTALGGYFGSRLNMNIREEKGYTYGIQSALLGKKNDSVIIVYTSCATAHTRLLIEEVKREMARLRQQLMPADELAVVKQHMLSDLMKTLDTPFSIARYVGDWFTCGVYPEYFNKQVEAIVKCTPEDVLQVAQTYLLEEKMLIAIAGDEEKMQL